jgi:hypothetical protein
MPLSRLLAVTLSCAVLAPAQAHITDLTTWDLYKDASGATTAQSDAMTGSATANLANLNFIGDVDIPAGFDIGYSSVNSNTVAGATSGYYFDASQNFTIRMHFSLDVVSPAGFVGIGMGIGEDRAGVNSAGIGFGVGTGVVNAAVFGAAATNNDTPITSAFALSETVDNEYFGSLTVSYDAASGDVTVGAAKFLGAPDPLAPTETFTFDGTTDLGAWAGDELLVSFFLRSDNPLIYNNWTGDLAEASFFDFTIVEGRVIQIPEPTSLALLGLGGLAMIRRR